MSATRSRQAIRTAVFYTVVALASAQAWGAGRAPAAIGTIERGGGHISSTELRVTATVSPSVLLHFDQRSLKVHVTEADIKRGYVDLPEDAMLSIDAGAVKPRLVVDFSPSGSAFTSVDLMTTDLSTGAERERGLNWLEKVRAARGGSSPHKFLGLTDGERTGTMMLFSYRFRLAPGVRPGSYQLPVLVDIGL
jgi:hypothetical protein